MNLIYPEESYKIIGAAMEVHRELGSGFLEAVYHEALIIELEKRGIPFMYKTELDLWYKGIPLKKMYVADFVCYDKIIIEIKALSGLSSQHDAQVINYLKATNFKLGLLINFGSESLEHKRLIRH
jgi:GxxExxY protein